MCAAQSRDIYRISLKKTGRIIALKYAFCPSYENPHPWPISFSSSSLPLSLFPSKGTFQRFVENKFEPRFGNANSIEISTDVIYKTRAFFGDLIINDILDILNYSISSSNFF